MDIPWIIDLDDHEASGILDFTRYHANVEREEVMSAVMDGLGPHGLYNITDTIMCKMPTGVTPEEASKMNHEHRLGFELFFVDSGSMYLYLEGRRCIIREGDILQLQPTQMHSMASIEDVKWRGFFHDLDSFNTSIAVNQVASRLGPDVKQDPAFQKAQGTKDYRRHEQPTFVDVPAETVTADLAVGSNSNCEDAGALEDATGASLEEMAASIEEETGASLEAIDGTFSLLAESQAAMAKVAKIKSALNFFMRIFYEFLPQ